MCGAGPLAALPASVGCCVDAAAPSLVAVAPTPSDAPLAAVLKPAEAAIDAAAAAALALATATAAAVAVDASSAATGPAAVVAAPMPASLPVVVAVLVAPAPALAPSPVPVPQTSGSGAPSPSSSSSSGTASGRSEGSHRSPLSDRSDGIPGATVLPLALISLAGGAGVAVGCAAAEEDACCDEPLMGTSVVGASTGLAPQAPPDAEAIAASVISALSALSPASSPLSSSSSSLSSSYSESISSLMASMSALDVPNTSHQGTLCGNATHKDRAAKYTAAQAIHSARYRTHKSRRRESFRCAQARCASSCWPPSA